MQKECNSLNHGGGGGTHTQSGIWATIWTTWARRKRRQGRRNIDSLPFKNSLKFLKYSPTTEGHNLTRDPHATSLIIENVTFADHV